VCNSTRMHAILADLHITINEIYVVDARKL